MFVDLMRGGCAVMMGLCVCLAGSGQVKAQQTIVQTAIDAGSFQTLVAAVKAAGLVETLSGPGPLTVFAPTDEAFAALPEGTVESLLLPENKAKLVAILTYHVVPGRVMASDVVQLDAAETVAGPRVKISTESGVRINDSTVVQADIACSNGVIHVIDQVLLPTSQNIAEVAAGAGQFGTLLAAADAAGLVPVLSGDGPLTVFAPTDEAFSALPKGTVASLLKPENRSKLAEILKYHVVSGRVYSNAALQLDAAPTVAGPLIKITPTDGGANINSARLVATDIDASNGVIHVIDRVLLPTDAPTANGGAVAAMKPAANSHVASAKTVLLNAIQQGVPIYNGGDHHGCAVVYMQALESVAAMNGSGLSAHSQNQVQQTLNQCRQMTSSTSRAWALRNRMDQLIMEL